jgi:hypothetical protein
MHDLFRDYAAECAIRDELTPLFCHSVDHNLPLLAMHLAEAINIFLLRRAPSK